MDIDLRDSEQRTGSAHLTGGNERVRLLLAGDVFASDGFRLSHRFTPTPVENGGLRENSDRERNTALAKITVGVTDSLKLGSLLSIGSGSNGLPPSTIDAPNDPFAQRARYERVEQYHTLTGQVSFGYLPKSPVNLRGWAFVNQQKEDRVRYDAGTDTAIDNPSVSGTFRRQDETRVSGGVLNGKYDWGGAGRLRLAVNGRREQFATEGVIRDVSVGGTPAGGGGGAGRGGGSTERTYDLRSFDERRHVDVYSLASEGEVRAPKDIWLVLGTAQNWQDRAEDARDSGTSWLAGATRPITKEMSVRGSVSHRVRFPSIRQLYEEGTGNAALEPERSYAAEIGLERRWGHHADASMTVFWMRTANFIERDEGDDRFTNQDRYRFAGFETTLRSQIIAPLDVWASYSFLDARDRSPSSERDELQNRPRHHMIVQPRWEFGSGVAAHAVLQYVADQVYYSRITPLTKARGDDYVLLDLTLAKTFGRDYEISAGVDNVFDELYADAYGLPREGRNARIRLRARF